MDSDDEIFLMQEPPSLPPARSLKRLRKAGAGSSGAKKPRSPPPDERSAEEILKNFGKRVGESPPVSPRFPSRLALDLEPEKGSLEVPTNLDSVPLLGLSGEAESDLPDAETPTEDEKEEEEEENEEEDEEDEEEEIEIDEDDEDAVLRLLEDNKKVADSATVAESMPIPKQHPEPHTDGEVGKKQDKSGKLKRQELEEIHATSQRLLRETRGVAFKAQPAVQKSVSSVLEKIRLRKQQLSLGLEKKNMEDGIPSVKEALRTDAMKSDDNVDVVIGDDEEDDLPDENAGEIKDGEGSPQGDIGDANEDDTDAVGNERIGDLGDFPSTPETDCEPVKSELAGKGGISKNASIFRAPLEDTQDLLCDSQLSNFGGDFEGGLGVTPATRGEDGEEEGASLQGDDDDDEIEPSGVRVTLQLDTQTQDEYPQSWPNDDSSKENRDLSDGKQGKQSRRVRSDSAVRALIDDEAEDEDEEELLLQGLRDDDDEGRDDGADLKDLVVATAEEEKKRDKARRAELHRKWLEQQDSAETDAILLRLKTGWAPKGDRNRNLSFLNEDDDGIFPGQARDVNIDNNDDGDDDEAIHTINGTSALPDDDEEEDPIGGCQDDEDDEYKEKAATSRGLLEKDEIHESSDEEEAEQRVFRQRLLQESEEQEAFLLPEDDETSREIFNLISKVNVATKTKKKSSGLAEARGGVLGLNNNSNPSRSNSSSNSKSSFLRKTVSGSSLGLPRHGSNNNSGSSRSFIFGRDDSNSCHALVNEESPAELDGKENSQSVPDSTKSNNFRSFQGKPVLTKSTMTKGGPSLFEVLKRQVGDFDKALETRSPNKVTLTAFKPIRSGRAPPPRGVFSLKST